VSVALARTHSRLSDQSERAVAVWGGLVALIVVSAGLLLRPTLPSLPWLTPFAYLLVLLGFAMVSVFAAGDATSGGEGKSLPLAAAAGGVVVLWLVPLLTQPGVLPQQTIPGGAGTAVLTEEIARLATAALLLWSLIQLPGDHACRRREMRLIVLSAASLSGAFVSFVVLVIAPRLDSVPAAGTLSGRILLGLTLVPLLIALMRRDGRHGRTQWADVATLAALIFVAAGAVVAATAPTPGSAGHYAQAILSVLPCVSLLLGQDRIHRVAVADATSALAAERARVRELSLLHDAAQALSWSTDREAVLNATVRQTAGVLGSETVRALVIEVRGNEASVTAEFPPQRTHSSVGARVDLGAHPSFSAARRRNSAMSWSIGACAEDLNLSGLQAGTGVCAPLLSGGRGMGLLAAWSRSATSLSGSDLRTLEGISALAGLALAHADGYLRLQNLASSDHLTGLLNRREFERVVAAQRGPHAVLAVDLDNLKIINDTYGHEAGDATLRSVAAVLRAAVDKEDVVARVGGDEFAVILRGIDEAGAAEVAERARCAMEAVPTPNRLGRVSIGVAWAAHVDPVNDLWERADSALYAAKRGGRNRVEVRRPSDVDELDERYRWEDEIDRLLSKRAVSAVYQPIVRLEDEAIVGVEALARPHGMGPLAHVDGLFATAQRLGLGPDVDWLCRRAAVENIGLIGGRAPLFINIGVSALVDPLHDVDQMELLLRWAGGSPADVVLEITEREAVRDLARFEAVLSMYREAGFRFALDDVGDGHSTFELIAATAPEYLKISALLVQRRNDRSARTAIRGIVAFAHVSEARVIAEGIETARDREWLHDLGVPLGQGFGLGRPVQPARLAALRFEREAADQSPDPKPLLRVVPRRRRSDRRRSGPPLASTAL
jgi:diguanylate cyclase (GGDEF)-like protein